MEGRKLLLGGGGHPKLLLIFLVACYIISNMQT